MKKDLKDLSLEELRVKLKALGQPLYRAEQVFEWVYQKGARNFGVMTDLPYSLRDSLNDKFKIISFEIVRKQVSRLDATRKYLFRLDDGETVEAVLIPARNRRTVCLSSQVGCAFGCEFCASGLMGLKRDLRCGEILEQALGVLDDLNGERLTNIVMMGAGEPLANYDNVMKAISVLNSPYGFAIGARKITISTAGYVPGIKRFMKQEAQIELSVSLHAANDKIRSSLMPINNKYPLFELMAACREYLKKKNRIITFEYVLIKDVNVSREDAKLLSDLLKGLSCKVNLIPFNKAHGLNFLPPSEKQVKEFQLILTNHGINSTIRAQRGADIDAACGQLRLRV
ncbi:MAG: 23S rRNA (adenine(2503)-C(2))-methyltransferase RlmN [Candidatus Omnitrophota bacterium]